MPMRSSNPTKSFHHLFSSSTDIPSTILHNTRSAQLWHFHETETGIFLICPNRFHFNYSTRWQIIISRWVRARAYSLSSWIRFLFEFHHCDIRPVGFFLSCPFGIEAFIRTFVYLGAYYLLRVFFFQLNICVFGIWKNNTHPVKPVMHCLCFQ